jgi:autotransporter-associated beta strand protein
VAFDQAGIAQPNVTVTGTLAPTTVEVNASGNYALGGTGSVASTGTITKRGTGTLTLGHLETYAGGSSLEAGAINLVEGGGLAGGKLTMLDGTIVANVHGSNNTASLVAPLEVPAGNRATIRTGNRISLSGALSGAGTLIYDMQTVVSRVDLKGASAAFSGEINFINSGGARLFYVGGSFNGFDAASVDVAGTVNLQPQTNSGGNTLNIGALSGTSAAASLMGGSAGMVTYVVGGKGADTTFAGSITGNAALTKAGAGTLTLSGANNYTGATSVSGGALIVAGSLGSTATSVSGGAMLAGSGTIGGAVTANAGSFLSPGTAPFTGTSMTVGGGLTLNANTLYFDLSSSPSGANDKIVMNGGTLGLIGSPTFQFSLLDGALAAGTYNLIAGATTSTVSGTPGTLPHNLVSGSRQTFTVKRSAAGSNPSLIWLEVLGNPATLTWTGATSAAWDTSTTNNWIGATPNTFSNNDAVVFDDSSTVNTIAIPAAISPRDVFANNATRAYTIGGNDPTVAAITGTASLTKSGAGALTLNGVNSFTGGTTINAGATITLANDNANSGALGAGRVTLNGGTLTMYSNVSGFNGSTFHFVVPAGQTGTFNADARTDIFGTLTGGGIFNIRIPWIRSTFDVDWSAFTGTINVTTDGNAEPGGGSTVTGDFRMGTDYSFAGFPNASVNLGDKVWAYYTGILASGAGTTIEIGELSGTAASVLQGGGTGGRNFTYRIGGKTPGKGEVTFAGMISEQNTSTTSSFVKTGAGTWKLSGTCAWNGGTTIEQGTLKISGSVSSGAATNVAPGAALTFAGGSLTTETLNVAATASVDGNGTITADVTNYGTITCGTGTLSVTGDVVNNGTMRVTSGAVLSAGGSFINNGVLDLLSSAAGLPPNLVNNGVVVDNRDRRIISAAKSGGDFTCTVQGYSGHTFQLQRADSPGGQWNNIGSPLPGAGSVLTLTDAGGATGAQKFYRVLVTP